MTSNTQNKSLQSSFVALELDSDKTLPYYIANVPPFPDETRQILEEYSKISPSMINTHVANIRDRAWEVKSYPCIGIFRFLRLGLPTLPEYPEIVSRLKSGQVFLDLGCCMGQEIRPLVHAGVPSGNLYGSDIENGFWDVGYDLFNDRKTLESKFLGGDIFDESTESPLNELNGKVDIIYAGSFFHLFSWDQQFLIAKRVIKLLSPVKGSMIVGNHLGRNPAGINIRWTSKSTAWRHDAESWEMLWKWAGKDSETQWDVRVDVKDFTEAETAFMKKFGDAPYRESGGLLEKANKFSFGVMRL